MLLDLGEDVVNGVFGLKGDEAEAAGLRVVAVFHDLALDDFAELPEVSHELICASPPVIPSVSSCGSPPTKIFFVRSSAVALDASLGSADFGIASLQSTCGFGLLLAFLPSSTCCLSARTF